MYCKCITVTCISVELNIILLRKHRYKIIRKYLVVVVKLWSINYIYIFVVIIQRSLLQLTKTQVPILVCLLHLTLVITWLFLNLSPTFLLLMTIDPGAESWSCGKYDKDYSYDFCLYISFVIICLIRSSGSCRCVRTCPELMSKENMVWEWGRFIDWEM